MPQYDRVDPSPQVPRTRHIQPPPPPEEKTRPITTDIPASQYRDLKVSCAINGIKVKDAVAQALEMWLEKYPAPKTD